MKTKPTVVKAEWSSCTAAQLDRSQQDSTSLKSTTGIESSVAIKTLETDTLQVEFSLLTFILLQSDLSVVVCSNLIGQ